MNGPEIQSGDGLAGAAAIPRIWRLGRGPQVGAEWPPCAIATPAAGSTRPTATRRAQTGHLGARIL